MHESIRSAIAALTLGEQGQRHFDLAAEQIQRALLDVRLPEFDRVDIGVHAEPARLVGGDYLDVHVRDGVLVVGLGDASGKSLAAALQALMLRYLVRGLLLSIGTVDLASVVKHTNAVVTADLHEEHFITFVLMTFDADSKVMRTVNAGHEPPLLLRSNAPDVHALSAHGVVLGIDPESSYAHEETQLGVGDLVMIYTDGLTEASNENGEMYTIARLEKYLVEHRDDSAVELADGVFESVKAHAGKELRDDATVFVMRVL